MIENAISIQWWIMIGVSLALLLLVPLSRTVGEFFKASSASGKTPGFVMLTSSLVISWIFAKSITNAANLGKDFGMVGGVAYSAYYLSFLVGGIVIWRLRTKGNFKSIHHFLQSRFGQRAVQLFTLLIVFRLFNEVWSNTMVIGSYFGEQGSTGYFGAILVFTALTLAYVLKGGMRSSLLTDAIQMGLFALLLALILGYILPSEPGNLERFVTSGEWTMAGGLNLLFVALLQVLSYPFHDPVLTDRGFLSSPKTTLWSFAAASVIGVSCIALFSFVGISASFQGLEGQAPVALSQSFGIGLMLAMNLIMVTSAASTLDSTFASFSKLAIIDLKLGKATNTVSKGRWAMVVLAVVGTIPVFLGAEILSATTISGTMVIGLAPVFLFWNSKAPKASFMLSVGTGMFFGIVLATGLFPEDWILFPGKYGDLLTLNLLGTAACFGAFFAPFIFRSRPFPGA